MQTPSTPESETPAPDKSRFKFQKLLHPFTWNAASRRRSSGFLLDWLVRGVAIASLLVEEAWWVKVFASLVAAPVIARLFVIGHDACQRLVHAE